MIEDKDRAPVTLVTVTLTADDADALYRVILGEHVKGLEIQKARVFAERMRAFVAETRELMLGQQRRVGASADWGRLRFTMDEGSARAVRVAFERLYRADLAYRTEYMAVRDAWAADPPPASTLLVVKGLALPACKVEIEAIAAG